MRLSILLFSLLITSTSLLAYSNLCVKINAGSQWGGGVFSVIDETGLTIATTNYIMKGSQGCAYNIAPGEYIVRFTGFETTPVRASTEISGCLSDSYLFKDEEVVTMVFDDGAPPFNNHKNCRLD